VRLILNVAVLALAACGGKALETDGGVEPDGAHSEAGMEDDSDSTPPPSDGSADSDKTGDAACQAQQGACVQCADGWLCSSGNPTCPPGVVGGAPCLGPNGCQACASDGTGYTLLCHTVHGLFDEVGPYMCSP
jgi:hypothetical protein